MIAIRLLARDDWQAFRTIRLAALQAHPGAYSATYAEAVQRSDAEWQAPLAAEDRAVFGLFDGAELVGITGVLTDRGDPSGETAMLVMSFIAPAYRGRGLSSLLYRARLAWIAQHPRFARVVVSHRASNEASRRANQRHGFTLTHVAPRTWPDGVVEDEVFYTLNMRTVAG